MAPSPRRRAAACLACALPLLLARSPVRAQDDAPGSEPPGDARAAQAADDAPSTPAVPPVARIRAALDAIGGYDAVSLDQEAGVIRLRGEVPTAAARQAAEQVAERAAPDALFVANAIEIVAPRSEDEADPTLAADETDQAIAGAIRRIFGAVDELRAVEVRVDGGIVHLRGTVREPAAADRAVEIAGERDGVIYVDADVAVEASLQEQLQATMTELEEKGREALGRLPVLGVALLIVLLALFLARWVARARVGSRVMKRSPLIHQMILRVVATLVLVGGVLLALDVLGATGVVGAILGTAGIVGLAVGFAFKDIVENYLAGILLAFHRPFAAGDLVALGEREGKVIRLSSRETILMTLEGNHLQIPNSEVFKATMVNYTRNPRRRFDFVVGVGTGEELAAAVRIGVEALEAMEGVMVDPAPFARVEGFGDSSMSVRFFGWVDQGSYDWFKVRSEAVRRVKRALDGEGIDVPNPIFDLDVFREEGRRAKHLRPAPAEPEAAPHDLSVDEDIDKQIAEDPEAQEVDLLEPGG
ncbi:MAG TPA: mechanosensitive ion channel [Polyangiaceae bacterium LLY-WYZ-15_(1-7)]|nr:mechanosensitive ion channel protein MscS [Myxococcales bacterium]MAT23908.1 mechanosensitive ion channel protein MscS [Sandaracinus sp.]HJK93655.1 mechanosensitive ion channel [Polyangiaceae bacterium LLY-WYZ-15_(1-7)]MBJ71197.1 mechanosensitive ion channel protein MscS [Sandaracinus sp.]HJL00520.1 mechanosensitive ion channel [Polyangiaceae bacterium LLY-WYZ-15_(1-7)]